MQGLRTINVLYLSHDGLTDPLGQSQILPYVIGLSKLGFRFTLISLEKKNKFDTLGTEVSSICQQNFITWLPLTYHNKPPVISTLFDVYRMRQLAVKLHHEKKFDLVHCRSYIPSLTGLYLKRRYGVRFIFDMRGFWADERVEGGLWNLKNSIYSIVYKFFKKRELEFFAEADHVISLTRKARNYIVGKFNIPENKIRVIPCSVDLDLFDPDRFSSHEKENVRTALNIQKDDFVLLYLGSLGTWYLYDEMVKYFNELKATKKDSKFLFITNDLDKVEKREDFIVVSLKRTDVPLYCSVANAGVLFIKPSFSKIASSATKMAELMALNIPVVTNSQWGDVEEIIAEAGGQLWPSQEPTAGISQVSSTRNYCRQHLSLESAIASYYDVYSSLLPPIGPN